MALTLFTLPVLAFLQLTLAEHLEQGDVGEVGDERIDAARVYPEAELALDACALCGEESLVGLSKFGFGEWPQPISRGVTNLRQSISSASWSTSSAR